SLTGNSVHTATVSAPAGTTDPVTGNISVKAADTTGPRSVLSVTTTDVALSYTAGTSTTYTIVASNAGPSDVTGASVVDAQPSGVSFSWTASYAGGGSGPASGSGSIGASVNLPVGGTASFTVTASISSSLTGDLVNTATV